MSSFLVKLEHEPISGNLLVGVGGYSLPLPFYYFTISLITSYPILR